MIDQFISLAREYGTSIDAGDNKSANKAHHKIMSLYKKLQSQNQLSDLEDLFTHEDINVRLWAATCCLRINEKKALDVLTKISESDQITGLTAKMTLDLWKNGLLQI